MKLRIAVVLALVITAWVAPTTVSAKSEVSKFEGDFAINCS